MTQRFSSKDFMRGIEAFGKKVKEAAEGTIKETMSIAFDTLIDQSPVWSGSYLLSHRIGVNGLPVAPPTNIKQPDPEGGMYPLKIGAGMAATYRVKAAAQKNLMQATNTIDIIEISNSIEYADEVEALKGAPFAAARLTAEAVVNQVKNKHCAKAKGILS